MSDTSKNIPFSIPLSVEIGLIIAINIILPILLAWVGNAVIAEYAIPIWNIYLAVGAIGTLVILLIFIKKYRPSFKEIQRLFTAVRTTSEATKNYIDDAETGHLVINCQEREIILNDDIFKTGNCILNNTIDLINIHKSSTYNSYQFIVGSHIAMSPREGFIISRKEGGKSTTYRLKDSDFKMYEHFAISKDGARSSEPVSWRCKINIPVNIAPGKHTRLTICENECPSFKILQSIPDEGEVVDSISTMVNFPCDKLIFKITIPKGQLQGYRLGRGGCKDFDGDIEMFKIVDNSNQWLTNYCHDLLARRPSLHPEYSKDGRTLTWTVDNPKMGCRYKLYFTLMKKTK